MHTQICSACNMELDISKFEWQKNRPNPRKKCNKCRTNERVYTDEHKKRISEYKIKYRKSGRAKEVWEKHHYGISRKDILYSHCVICGSTHNLGIDHCHNSGIFRGLLCSKCNSAIGLFDEDIDKMFNAIKYILHFKNGGESFKNSASLRIKG